MQLAPRAKKQPPGGAVGAWYTPPGLARAVVRWAGISDGENVVDLGAGRGHLTRACLDAGARVTAIEIDETCRPALAALCPEAHIVIADALGFGRAPISMRFDRAILNPPFEGDLPEQMILAALRLAHRAVAIVPLNVFAGVSHFESLWRVARGARELRCVRRPSFDGIGAGQRDIVAVEIEPRPARSVAGRDEDVVRVTYLARWS